MHLEPHDRILLVNTRIVDVEKGCYFPAQVSLVIQDGRILAMPGLPGEPDQVNADAVIDLHGHTVIPGLFNTHCHMQLIPPGDARERQVAKNLSDCVERGITNIRDALAYDLLESRAWMDKISHGEILGPRIHQAVHVSPLGGTYAPHLNPFRRLLFSFLGVKLIDYKLNHCGAVVFPPGASLQQVRDAVDRAIDERGAMAIKFCDQPEHFITYKPGAQVISAAQLAAAADQAAKRGLPTTMHNVTVDGFRMGLQAGLTSLAHIPIDHELGEADAVLFQGSPTFIEPTVTVGYFIGYNVKGSRVFGHPDFKRLDEYREHSYRGLVEEVWLPELQTQSLAMHTALQKGSMKIFGLIDLSAPFVYYSRAIPTGGKNISLLLQHGGVIRLGCGNDAGPANCSAATIHHELTMFDFMFNQGATPAFTPSDLLRIATLQSARSMGVDERFGSIKPGKVADLAIVDGDPLQDYHLVGTPVQALFMDGKLVLDRCGLQLSQPASQGQPPL